MKKHLITTLIGLIIIVAVCVCYNSANYFKVEYCSDINVDFMMLNAVYNSPNYDEFGNTDKETCFVNELDRLRTIKDKNKSISKSHLEKVIKRQLAEDYFMMRYNEIKNNDDSFIQDIICDKKIKVSFNEKFDVYVAEGMFVFTMDGEKCKDIRQMIIDKTDGEIFWYTTIYRENITRNQVVFQ